MDKHSYIGNSSPEVIEDLYRQYLVDAENVEPSWRQFFSIIGSRSKCASRFESETEIKQNRTTEK